MQRRRGMTLVELLTVIGILMALAGLVFFATASGRESAKQTSCLSQLRQINAAMQLYAIDYTECVYGSSVTFVNSVHEAIDPYGMTKALYYCPDTPAPVFKYAGSSYFWNTMLWPAGQDASWVKRREEKIRRMLDEGPSYVVVECDVHDQVYFQPREKDVDPSIVGAFRIQLFADGSVRRKRVDVLRSQLFLGGG